jgi:hypothetical protein
MQKKRLLGLVLPGILLASLLAPAPARAQGVIDIEIDGNEVSATVALGHRRVGLGLSFEDAVGLTAANLGMSARIVNPLDWRLRSRLGGSGLISLPFALPVLVSIEPPAEGGLSFSGVYSIRFHTHALLYGLGCPLRLYAAEAGGPFHDITAWMGSGSYRARGARGTFSEFLIVLDLRPQSAVIPGKFDRLEDLLAEHAALVPPALGAELAGLVADARDEYEDDDPEAASALVGTFADTVESHSGEDIPDVWRSARDLVNVAGELRSAAETLRFSLDLAGG